MSELGILHPKPEAMTWNHRYAAAMCRIHYRRQPGELWKLDTVEKVAEYWKEFYNTPKGKGTVEHFLEAWESR